jgi:hypothetical protein
MDRMRIAGLFIPVSLGQWIECELLAIEVRILRATSSDFVAEIMTSSFAPLKYQ